MNSLLKGRLAGLLKKSLGRLGTEVEEKIKELIKRLKSLKSLVNKVAGGGKLYNSNLEKLRLEKKINSLLAREVFDKNLSVEVEKLIKVIRQIEEGEYFEKVAAQIEEQHAEIATAEQEALERIAKELESFKKLLDEDLAKLSLVSLNMINTEQEIKVLEKQLKVLDERIFENLKSVTKNVDKVFEDYGLQEFLTKEVVNNFKEHINKAEEFYRTVGDNKAKIAELYELGYEENKDKIREIYEKSFEVLVKGYEANESAVGIVVQGRDKIAANFAAMPADDARREGLKEKIEGLGEEIKNLQSQLRAVRRNIEKREEIQEEINSKRKEMKDLNLEQELLAEKVKHKTIEAEHIPTKRLGR